MTESTESIYASGVPTLAAEGGASPRLAPIDRYAGFWLAIMRAAFRFMFGK